MSSGLSILTGAEEINGIRWAPHGAKQRLSSFPSPRLLTECSNFGTGTPYMGQGAIVTTQGCRTVPEIETDGWTGRHSGIIPSPEKQLHFLRAALAGFSCFVFRSGWVSAFCNPEPSGPLLQRFFPCFLVFFLYRRGRGDPPSRDCWRHRCVDGCVLLAVVRGLLVTVVGDCTGTVGHRDGNIEGAAVQRVFPV